MRKLSLCIIVALLLMLGGFALADTGSNLSMTTSESKESEEKEEPKSICPRTRMKDGCLTCHTKDWRTKEVPWDAVLDYPGGLKFYKAIGETVPTLAYYKLSSVYSDEFKRVLDYLDIHNIHYLIIDVQSFGGSAFEMWRIVGHMKQWKSQGNIIQTEVNGVAISAGFVIFTSGSKGHRLVNPAAELMWHEAQMLEWPQITTPTDTEKKANVYRHFQDTCHTYLATVSNLTKEEIDAKVRDLQWWMTGLEAIECGFADGVIGEDK